ncbi:response regulator [Hymenobacter sp. 5414T-23]|uniref:response regulator n=1 Tax=Hymenobacter sp. 5414T-23 TaxID=2932252 RepID=UPI001FD5296D|nr:response regulator [Hymenobacter sp. 5414T-23]UOQ82886.1 response regulator [Hymenobacter sp. 5414T-23]
MSLTFPSTLLVDDDPTTNYLNRKLLERIGFTDQVMVALNGQEALQVLNQHCQDNSPTCPTLLFLDVNMPLMDGFEFLTAYQKLPLAERQAIVIVMLTTSVHPRDLQRLEQLPVAGFLSKPLTEDKVKKVLAENFN